MKLSDREKMIVLHCEKHAYYDAHKEDYSYVRNLIKNGILFIFSNGVYETNDTIMVGLTDDYKSRIDG